MTTRPHSSPGDAETPPTDSSESSTAPPDEDDGTARRYAVVRSSSPGAHGVRYTVTRSTAEGASVTTTYELSVVPPLLEHGWSARGNWQGALGGLGSLGGFGSLGGSSASMPLTWEQLYLASWFFPRQMTGWFASPRDRGHPGFDHGPRPDFGRGSGPRRR